MESVFRIMRLVALYLSLLLAAFTGQALGGHMFHDTVEEKSGEHLKEDNVDQQSGEHLKEDNGVGGLLDGDVVHMPPEMAKFASDIAKKAMVLYPNDSGEAVKWVNQEFMAHYGGTWNVIVGHRYACNMHYPNDRYAAITVGEKIFVIAGYP